MRHVTIIGAGFSGLALAHHLAGRAQVTLVEAATPATGPAYRARNEALKLNAPAERMSLDPAEPLDFVHFLERRGRPSSGFVPRAWYADYLAERLARLLTSGAQLVREEVLDLAPQFEVQLASGARLRADEVVLATGNAPPARPASLLGDRNVLFDPWEEGALADLPRDARVLLLGTGLSALDVALQLSRQGHRGQVVALSRSGRWPLPHLADAAPAVELEALPPTVRGALRLARQRARDGAPWQRVVDALRANAEAWWSTLPLVERTRLLRVALPLWNRHRHRAPAELLAEVAQFKALAVRRGRARVLDARGERIDATLVLDGVPARTNFEALVVCTGPTLRRPLLERLEARGLVRFEPFDFGVTPLVSGLHVLGALARWQHLEATAALELGAQARALAEALTRPPSAPGSRCS